MAEKFRASNEAVNSAYLKMKITANSLKENLIGVNVDLAAGDASYDFLREIYVLLSRSNVRFNQLKTTPGLLVWAQQVESDPAYDVVAAFTGMQSAIAEALSWMGANVPTSVTAKNPASWLNESGSLILTVFSPAQTAGLRTQLSAVIATIA